MLAKNVSRTSATQLPDIDVGAPTPPPAPPRAYRKRTPRANSATVVPTRKPSDPQPATPEPDLETESEVRELFENESARHKFERLCVARMNRALTSIRLLGNLASPNYRWDEADVVAVRNSLVAAVNDTLAKFDRRKKTKPQFALPTVDSAGLAPESPES